MDTPRPVVAKLLHHKDRDLLLQRAHETGHFEVENSRVNMYPDYTAVVQAKRVSYTEVKKALRTEGIRYALLLPSKLKIWNGRTHFCLSPEEAWFWLESYRTGREDQNLQEPPTTRGWRKRRRSGDRPRRDRVLQPTQMQASQENGWRLRRLCP
ncbi:hypothetical protein NDU88_008723 [Pleurodeles waltl]|uniref:Uncharacterized protein n=1 Tax=Pleurodeles waltl TaxID=8319 RepID=A0AAV7RYF8_PLEWA|nr:hypothetical protein NDU88_008723 [Pleurodeles waltl]